MDFVEHYLGRGEKVRRTTREHVIGLVQRLALRAIQLIVVYLIASMVGHEAVTSLLNRDFLTELGVGVILRPIPALIVRLCLFAALLLLIAGAIDAFRWREARYVLTDRRVLSVRGGLTRVVVDTPLDQVAELALRQSLLGRRFDYGDVLLRTPADHAERPPMRFINDPIGFRTAIDKRRQQLLDKHPAPPSTPTSIETSEVNRTLRRLVSLRDEGLLSADEFELRRREFLQQL